MPREQEGQLINLVWPDGNDEGEIFVRGHVTAAAARQTALAESSELDDVVLEAFADPATASDDDLGAYARERVDRARVEYGYARWSCEMDVDFGEPDGQAMKIRYYRHPGRGRFPVTRLRLSPDPACHLSRWINDDVFTCTKCGRRFRLAADDIQKARAPADCSHLVGDEAGPLVPVAKELPPQQPMEAAV
jgi:hypothetical protein